jgi:hypothetical protein
MVRPQSAVKGFISLGGRRRPWKITKIQKGKTLAGDAGSQHNKGGNSMAEDKAPSDQVHAIITQNIEQARRAMTNYFQFLEESIAASPVGVTDQTKTLRDYVERNVAASFQFSDKLLHAKDLQDVVRMQTDFFQTQLRALNAPSQGLGDKAVKIESEVINAPIK